MNGIKLFILTLVLFVYLLLGAVVFHFLEQDNETSVLVNALDLRARFLSNYSCVSEDAVNQFVSAVLQAKEHGITITGNSSATQSNWDFSSAFFFSGTVVTTIGYGNISPTTFGGQSFVIIYAMFGIPLCGVVLAQMGTKLNLRAKRLSDRLAACLERQRMIPWLSAAIQGGVMVALVLGIFMVVPAAVFARTEGWSYREAWYYCFVTLTTIGFGDYIVGTNTDIPYTVVYKWLTYVWIFLGLVVMATIISLSTDWLSEKTEKATLPGKKASEEESDKEKNSSEDAQLKLNEGAPTGENGADNGVEMTQHN